MCALYREFEAALLSLMPAAGSGEVEEARAEQAGRVERLWCRQLRQPLLGMDTAYQEYSKQAGGNVNQLLTVEYKKARYKAQASFILNIVKLAVDRWIILILDIAR